MRKVKGVMTWPERRVAKALNEAGLIWKYEWEAVLDHGNGYESVKYPDFYLPEPDIYVEVLSLSPTEESEQHLQKKLRFYEDNELDYITVDVRREGRYLKPIRALREEIEEQVYSMSSKKSLSYFSHKRYIDDFAVSREGYRMRSTA